jgi:hypothetical protein
MAAVKHPEVEQKAGRAIFEALLESNGRSQAEMALKSCLRQLLSKQPFQIVAVASIGC